MPPPRRLAALWRGTHRCLTTTTTTTTAASRTLCTATPPASACRPRPQMLGGTPQSALAVRCLSDNVTRRPDGAAAAPIGGSDDVLASLAQTQQQQQQESLPQEGGVSAENQEALERLSLLAQGLEPFDVATDGHKFGLSTGTARPTAVVEEETDLGSGSGSGSIADLALPQVGKLQDRYDPVVSQLTRLLMHHGKLAKAQRDMAMILNYLRTSPPPKLSPARPLLPGHPPAAQLPLHPELYLTLAIDSIAPLVKIRQYAKLAGGGQALPVPFPLAQRQRRRAAFMWLLDIVNKKPSRGSGRSMLAHRIGEEVVAIVEGRSGLWDRRQLLHKQATSARANLSMVKL